MPGDIYLLIRTNTSFTIFLIDGKKNFIYAATSNPVSVYAMEEDADAYAFLDLYGMFPSTRYRWKPTLSISILGDSMKDRILLHEETVITDLTYIRMINE